ncbi:Crp/Fnr family transcriptional regulator [Sporomusa termitida]|uniref:Cyclic nucleotide-binding domain protein n=1 Tax=Sporomusa termitida TaxID=2377 RepID=A0A517DYJ2_9FIRM|nr:Crp/Fnr family transcriptional regulator [Sporomusa termitida]QDR82412.1 Cyclic nucleotide-binding domain protein [Sporomusa termitida]
MENFFPAIASCPLFKNCSRSDLERFLEQAGYKIGNYRKNQFIFRMDQPITDVGIILKGSVEVQKIFPSGKVVNLICKEKGELFAEGTIFSSLPAYPCQVIARATTDVMLLPKQYLIRALADNSVLLANFLALMADKLVFLNKKIELLSYCSIQSKIAYSLVHCIATAGNAGVIKLPYTQKAWAEHLNVSRPSLCRELKNLCQAKILLADKGTITILRQDKLEALLNE